LLLILFDAKDGGGRFVQNVDGFHGLHVLIAKKKEMFATATMRTPNPTAS
jgi:hypothetical protein